MFVRYSMGERRQRVSLRVLALAIVLAALASLLMSATSAMAGQYHVYSCRTPWGESASTEGWSSSEAGSEPVVEDTCAQGGALVAGLKAGTERMANSPSVTWAFTVPAAAKLVGATLWRAGDADGGTEAEDDDSYQFRFAGPTETSVFEECLPVHGCTSLGDPTEPLADSNRIAVPANNLGSQLFLTAACDGVSGYPCPDNSGDGRFAAVVYLYAADMTLEQSSPPTVSSVAGELANAPTVAGTSDVSFVASDAGAGVYQAVVSVDGQVMQSSVIDENDGRCHDVGGTSDGLPAFTYSQPCPASLSAEVGFDSTKVSDGVHHLVVSVTDAAGNSTVVLERNVTVDNPPPPGGPNGANASAQARLTVGWKDARGTRIHSGFGRSEMVVGRLTTPAGTPIGAASVAVAERSAYAGALLAPMTSVTTNAQGRFELRLPKGLSSRALSFSYSSQLGAPPVVTRSLQLTVRAGLQLTIAPRTASVGHSIYFSGRLLGGPVPSGGKPLVLEARSPGGSWLEFDVVRTNSRGGFHATYRFKFAGPARYQFRVLCEAEADYPFASGASNVVGVFER